MKGGHPEGIAMIRIAGLPVRTRLPITAWVVAGLVALCTMVPSLMQFIASGGTAMPEAHQASVADLLGSLPPL